MIVRCAGCGGPVSEWAARCAHCGTGVEESLAAAAAAHVGNDDQDGGPRVVQGVVIGDAEPDPATVMWSRAASTVPVWDRVPAATVPVGSVVEPPVTDAVRGDAVDEAFDVDQVDSGGDDSADGGERRRRPWLRATAAVAGLFAVAALVVAVVLPSDNPGEDAGGWADPNALAPIAEEPVQRWSTDVGGRAVVVAAADDTVYTSVVRRRSRPPVVVAIDRASGDVRWEHEMERGSEESTALVATPSGVLVLPSFSAFGTSSESPSESHGVLLDRDTGGERWRLDGTWFPIGARADRFLLLGSGEDEDLHRLDTQSGTTERLPGRIVGISRDRILLYDGSAVVAYDRATVAESGRWVVPTDRAIEAAAVVGSNLVVTGADDLVVYDSGGRERTLATGGRQVGWLVHLEGDRVLSVAYGLSTEVALVDLGATTPMVWSEWTNLMWMVSPTVALVADDDHAVLMRVGDDGFDEIADLGEIDTVSGFVPTVGQVLLADDDAVTAIGGDGSEVWRLDVDLGDLGSLWTLDGALVAVDRSTVTLYA